MMLPEKVIADTSVAIAKNTTSGFISYVLHMWFWWFYKDFLKTKIVLSKEAEILAKKEIIEKYWNTDLWLIEKMKISESEIEYKNMAWVLSKLPWKISENAEWNIDPDKMKRLKDLSKEYSSEEMQEYIAKILAGEYNKSWTYSLQTLEILKSISKEELEIFQKFKSVITEWDAIFSHIFQTQEMMKKFDVNYDDLLLLNSLNLISWKISKRWLPENQLYPFGYNSKLYFLKYNGKKELNGLYFLTRSGREIYNLLDDNYNWDYVEYLKDYLSKYEIQMIELDNLWQADIIDFINYHKQDI